MPPCWVRFGMLNTRMPPVFSVATLSYTSALMVFSISMPATLRLGAAVAHDHVVRLADVDAGVGGADRRSSPRSARCVDSTGYRP